MLQQQLPKHQENLTNHILNQLDKPTRTASIMDSKTLLSPKGWWWSRTVLMDRWAKKILLASTQETALLDTVKADQNQNTKSLYILYPQLTKTSQWGLKRKRPKRE